MRLLLDTHTFLWFVWDIPMLSASARLLIEEPGNEIVLSLASVWEVAIKVSTGKMGITQPLETFFAEQCRRNHFSLLPIKLHHVAYVSTLPFHHRDPFDRLLVAQSLTEKIPLISVDAVLAAYGVDRRW